MLIDILMALAAGVWLTGPDAWITQVYGPETFLAESDRTDVPESSGVVASRIASDVYWTHNDSGARRPRVWAFRLTSNGRNRSKAASLGYVELMGASNQDWEDIAAGPGKTIYVFDGGDNPPCKRDNKRIHRFVEPSINSNDKSLALAVRYETFRFEYPRAGQPSRPAIHNDDRYDAECLCVHPITGDIYVVTKRDNQNRMKARVYKLPASNIRWNTNEIHVLEFVTDILTHLPSNIANTITAGDIDPTGRRMVIRNYVAAFEYLLPTGQPFDAIFTQKPTMYLLPLQTMGLFQGEGICYDRDGRDLIMTTEVGPAHKDSKFRVFGLPWLLANLRVEDVNAQSAVVCWDTARPSTGKVEYGTGAILDQSTSDATKATSHSVKMNHLKSKTRYYYRVVSEDTSYPTTAPAAEASFVTESGNSRSANRTDRKNRDKRP